MRIAFVFEEGAYGVHRPPLDFADIESGSLTGSDLAFVKHAAALAKRGHEVVVYAPRVTPMTSPEELIVRRFDKLEGDLALERFDAAVALGFPCALKLFPASTARVVNRQCARFGADSGPNWEGHVDLVTCPSDAAREHVSEGLKVPFATVPNGCEPSTYRDDLRIPGRVVYTSSPDRGLHWLLQEWPAIKRAVTHASLRIYYYSLDAFLAEFTHPQRPPDRGTARARYIKHALTKLADLDVRAVSGVSHRQLATELSQAEVFAYPCDPFAYTETFSVATLEACAAGVVPVVTTADALGGIYGDALPESIVPAPVSENLGQFTANVIRGLTDADYRSRVTERARAFAARHTWEQASLKLEILLEELVHRKRAPIAVPRTTEHYDAPVSLEVAVAFRENASVQAYLSPAAPARDREPAPGRRIDRPMRKPVVHLVLSPYASNNVAIDLDDPFYESEGGGCRAGFLGLARALGARGDFTVRAFSTFKRAMTKDGVQYVDVRTSSLTAGDPDAVLAYYDTQPLIGLPPSLLRIASHHSFNVPCQGSFDWHDLNLAPCEYAVQALAPVFDQTGPWAVLPNASVEIERVAEALPGRVLYHTSASRGLHLLVEAWPAIRRGVPHATLHVVGNALSWCEALKARTGRSADRARALLAALPAANDAGGVTFLGFLPRRAVVREICEASVFAYPSTTVAPSETFSVSVLECLKAGTPVVLSPCDALESVWAVDGGVVFALAPAERHMDDFVDRVVGVLNAQGTARAQLVSDAKRAAARFTFEKSAAALADVLHSHLSARARAA